VREEREGRGAENLGRKGNRTPERSTSSKFATIHHYIAERDRATAAWVSFGQKWKRILQTL